MIAERNICNHILKIFHCEYNNGVKLNDKGEQLTEQRKTMVDHKNDGNLADKRYGKGEIGLMDQSIQKTILDTSEVVSHAIRITYLLI